jgi:hypothetical protein
VVLRRAVSVIAPATLPDTTTLHDLSVSWIGNGAFGAGGVKGFAA